MSMSKTKPRAKAKPEGLTGLSLKGDRLLTTREAALLLSLSPKTLRQLRCDKAGPPCLKLGTRDQARVVYRLSDLERWVERTAHVVVG